MESITCFTLSVLNVTQFNISQDMVKIMCFCQIWFVYPSKVYYLRSFFSLSIYISPRPINKGVVECKGYMHEVQKSCFQKLTNKSIKVLRHLRSHLNYFDSITVDRLQVFHFNRQLNWHVSLFVVHKFLQWNLYFTSENYNPLKSSSSYTVSWCGAQNSDPSYYYSASNTPGLSI